MISVQLWWLWEKLMIHSSFSIFLYLLHDSVLQRDCVVWRNMKRKCPAFGLNARIPVQWPNKRLALEITWKETVGCTKRISACYAFYCVSEMLWQCSPKQHVRVESNDVSICLMDLWSPRYVRCVYQKTESIWCHQSYDTRWRDVLKVPSLFWDRQKNRTSLVGACGKK